MRKFIYYHPELVIISCCAPNSFTHDHQVMRAIISIVVALIFSCLTPSSVAQSLPQFEDYEVSVYTGAMHRPKWIRHVSGDGWRDNLGKLVEPPEVNFAGK